MYERTGGRRGVVGATSLSVFTIGWTEKKNVDNGRQGREKKVRGWASRCHIIGGGGGKLHPRMNAEPNRNHQFFEGRLPKGKGEKTGDFLSPTSRKAHENKGSLKRNEE